MDPTRFPLNHADQWLRRRLEQNQQGRSRERWSDADMLAIEALLDSVAPIVREQPWMPLSQAEARFSPDLYDQLPPDQREAIDRMRRERECWINDRYFVILGPPERHEAWGLDSRHLSIRNNDRSARHDWRDFQRIKDQLCGPAWEAIELYPAADRCLDEANQFHLWAFNGTLPIGFDAARVAMESQYRHIRCNSVQRPAAPPSRVELVRPRPGSPLSVTLRPAGATIEFIAEQIGTIVDVKA